MTSYDLYARDKSKDVVAQMMRIHRIMENGGQFYIQRQDGGGGWRDLHGIYPIDTLEETVKLAEIWDRKPTLRERIRNYFLARRIERLGNEWEKRWERGR